MVPLKEIVYVICVMFVAITVTSLKGEFCEIHEKIRQIEARTARMQANPRPQYVEATTD